jgi:hypothetical protein
MLLRSVVPGDIDGYLECESAINPGLGLASNPAPQSIGVPLFPAAIATLISFYRDDYIR